MEYRRPKAGDAPQEGLLKVERREFGCLGFRVLVFRCSGVQVFRCSGVQVFRCSGVQVFRCLGV